MAVCVNSASHVVPLQYVASQPCLSQLHSRPFQAQACPTHPCITAIACTHTSRCSLVSAPTQYSSWSQLHPPSYTCLAVTHTLAYSHDNHRPKQTFATHARIHAKLERTQVCTLSLPRQLAAPCTHHYYSHLGELSHP
uniref:Uncharacterized protein n=1 Tax=Chlamydomonas chlamydogama TaxID=225041 RepID=A0A7S2QUU3_9CHLO